MFFNKNALLEEPTEILKLCIFKVLNYFLFIWSEGGHGCRDTTYHGICVKIRGQLAELADVSPLLPPSGIELNSYPQAWHQVPLPAQASHQPLEFAL